MLMRGLHSLVARDGWCFVTGAWKRRGPNIRLLGVATLLNN